MPVEDGFTPNRPGQFGGEQQASDFQPASHHALSTAYNDLKKRYHDLEQKNKQLVRKLKEYQIKRGSPLSSVEITPSHSREGSPQLSGTGFSTNGDIEGTVCTQNASIELQQLVEKIRRLQEHEQKLLEERSQLHDRCRDVEHVNEALIGENDEFKQARNSFLTQCKARESDLTEKNHKLENENEQYLRKIMSLEKRLLFLEKQLKEQKTKNSLLEEEYLLSKTELQRHYGSLSPVEGFEETVDTNESIVEDLKCSVNQYRLELRDLFTVIYDQQDMIEKLACREADRNKILSVHRRNARATGGPSSITPSSGARPKTSVQRSPSFKSKPAECQQADTSIGDQRRYPNTLGPFDGVVHDKYHRRSSSQGSYEQSLQGRPGNDLERSRDDHSQSYKLEVMANWLGQLDMARNDSLEHLHDDTQEDDDVLGNIDILDNLEDNMATDPDDFDSPVRPSQKPSVPDSLPKRTDTLTSVSPTNAQAVSRASPYPSSTLPRRSTRSPTGPGLNLNINPHVRSTSANRRPQSRVISPTSEVENRFRPNTASQRPQSRVISPTSEVENRFRPNSASQQPRPLNIERNEDVSNLPRSYDNTNQNVNLNIETEKDRPERPENLILNNDPLAGHKVIPNKNIYREDQYRKDNPIRGVTPGESTRTCPICNYDFPSSTSMEEFQQHVLDCCDSTEVEAPTMTGGATVPSQDDRVCPVCNSEFPYTVGQKDYEAHVMSHFEEEEAARNRFEMVEP